jgi:beta-lactamase class A
VRLDDELLTERDPARLFSGASLIKTPIAALVTEDVAAGRRAWDEPVAIDDEMRAPGDGLLRSLELPRSIALDEALMLMIAVSDNSATNALVALLGGLDAVNERLRDAGWSSRIRRWIGGRHAVADDLPADPALPSAAGASRICISDHQDALARVLALDEGSGRAFEAQQDRRALARGLSADARFAHKTATVGRVRHDAGVLLGEHGALWVACLIDGGPPEEHVDHPACIAMGAAMADTLRALGLESLLALPGA